MSRSAWTSSARTRPTALGRSTSSAGSTGVWLSTISSALSTGTTALDLHPYCIAEAKGPRLCPPPPVRYDGYVIPTVEWRDGEVVLIDQRRLPAEQVMIRCRTHSQVAAAIKDMAIRGAPAIGVTAALGVALGVRNAVGEGPVLRAAFDDICRELAATRPTAVNLFWAIERMRRRFEAEQDLGGP